MARPILQGETNDGNKATWIYAADETALACQSDGGYGLGCWGAIRECVVLRHSTHRRWENRRTSVRCGSTVTATGGLRRLTDPTPNGESSPDRRRQARCTCSRSPKRVYDSRSGEAPHRCRSRRLRSLRTRPRTIDSTPELEWRADPNHAVLLITLTVTATRRPGFRGRVAEWRISRAPRTSTSRAPTRRSRRRRSSGSAGDATFPRACRTCHRTSSSTWSGTPSETSSCPQVASSPMLVWMDLEMTGLDHTADVIVEIATLVTDDELNVVAEGPDIAIHHPDEVLMRMDPFVVDMHTRSGLLDQIRASTFTLEEAGAADARLHQGACPRAADGAAVRQLDRHRSPLPRRVPARDRGVPALPLGRRVVDQGARSAAGIPTCSPSADGRPARTAPSTTSARASPSCSSTASSCSPPPTSCASDWPRANAVAAGAADGALSRCAQRSSLVRRARGDRRPGRRRPGPGIR